MDITVEELEKPVTQLPQDQLRTFRAWYEKFDSGTIGRTEGKGCSKRKT